MECCPPGSSVHGILQAKILEWVAMPSSTEFSQPRSPTLQKDSLLSEPPGKPKNTGVGSLTLLQDIFPTQRFNPGLLHCRRILYCLSCQGSPRILEWVLQDTFPTQGLNQDLLHCRWIPYQLSHQGNPLITGLPGNSRESLFYLFIYSFLAVLGLHCCVSTSLVAATKGCSLIEARGLLLFQNMGSRAFGLLWLRLPGSRAQAQ